jgi:trans-2,3-dihydro-3-hydroxyanthranilate isomerase
MDKRPFYIIDVFAEQKYAGNQLAVFRYGSRYSDTEMQKLAKEMNYSETTFIMTDEERDGGYDVRIFTPEHEIPFAGHPTLGTAYVVQREIVRSPVERVNLNLGVGQIPIRFTYSGPEPAEMWMRQVPPAFGETFDAGPVAEALTLRLEDIDSRFPIQSVSTGLPFMIVPLRDLQALKRASVRRTEYLELIARTEAKATLLFCPEATDSANNISVRVFADYYGVPEDPATGSANGCLAGYLVRHSYFGTDHIDIRSEQGHQVGRPSLLLLRAQAKKTDIEVKVGGRAIMVATGELV